MPTPGKRGGGFAPGSAADRRAKRRGAKILATAEEKLRPSWHTPNPPAISSVAHVEAIFDQIAAMFRAHGDSHDQKRGTTLTLGDYALDIMLASPAGPFEAIFGPKVVVYRRPDKTPPKFGWLERIDFRQGSPTALLAVAGELRELTK